MLRIEAVAQGDHETAIRATGRLAGPWVGELERCLWLRSHDASVVVDLSDVTFVDRAGIELLQALRRDGRIRLRCSAFVAEQLHLTEARS